MDDRETAAGYDRGAASDRTPDELPPLPPPPPVGAPLPDAGDDEFEAYEPPPLPGDGALWAGFASIPEPEPASVTSPAEDGVRPNPRVAATMYRAGDVPLPQRRPVEPVSPAPVSGQPDPPLPSLPPLPPLSPQAVPLSPPPLSPPPPPRGE